MACLWAPVLKVVESWCCNGVARIPNVGPISYKVLQGFRIRGPCHRVPWNLVVREPEFGTSIGQNRQWKLLDCPVGPKHMSEGLFLHIRTRNDRFKRIPSCTLTDVAWYMNKNNLAASGF